tara:strand:- start:531 stop:1403 length:873 start_codon:yes stop_codon:yes gene_type:complete
MYKCIKSLITNLFLKSFFVDLLNLFFNSFLRIKKILDGSFSKQGKFFKILPDDTFIVSYPKSGNNWVRFIVANLINKNFKNINFENLDQIVPDIHETKESELNKLKDPRIFSSHDYFDVRFNKVIYIIRDPRDVIVSTYFYLSKLKILKNNYPKRRYVQRFLDGEFDSTFGSWYQNVGSWHGTKNKNILFIRYEDMLKNKYTSIKKISEFLNIKHNKKKLNKVLENTHLKSLQKQEIDTQERVSFLKDTRKDIRFFRSGKSNQWKQFLSAKESKLIKKKWGTYMKIFNYI